MQLRDTGTPNDFNIHFTPHGDKEPFPTDILSISPQLCFVPRYFSFGSHTDIGTQLSILKQVTGDDTTLDTTTAKRRKESWKSWYANDMEGGASFEILDLPVIAETFQSVWGIKEFVSGEAPSRDVTSQVGDEIRSLLYASNCIEKRARVETPDPVDTSVSVTKPVHGEGSRESEGGDCYKAAFQAQDCTSYIGAMEGKGSRNESRE